MKAKQDSQIETSREPQPGEQVLVCYIESGSDLEQYFADVDVELMKKYDHMPVDDESL